MDFIVTSTLGFYRHVNSGILSSGQLLDLIVMSTLRFYCQVNSWTLSSRQLLDFIVTSTLGLYRTISRINPLWMSRNTEADACAQMSSRFSTDTRIQQLALSFCCMGCLSNRRSIDSRRRQKTHKRETDCQVRACVRVLCTCVCVRLRARAFSPRL